MITVYTVSKQDFPATRLHMPGSQWGFSVRERLSQMGFSVQASDQEPEPDTRGADELARRDELLELAEVL